MKKYLKRIILILITFLIFSGCFIVIQQSNWKTYTNINPSFSFNYPSSWGEPRIYKDQENTKFGIDFGNYAFYVNNGYYFMDIDGKRPTISQLVKYYKDDMDSKNEVKDFQIENLKIDNYSAIKVNVNTLIGEHYTDIYIYEDQKNQDKFILITVNKNFTDDKTLNKILSTFKLGEIKNANQS